jgi:hypothetical protein
LRDELHPHLIQRIRVGAMLIGVSIVLYGMLELWQQRAPLMPFLLVKVVQVATLCVVWLALDPAGSWHRSVGLALALVAEVCVTLAISGILTGEVASAPLLCVLVTLGTATLLPWGLAPQVVTVAVAAASLAANAAWTPVPDGFGYTVTAASMACLASLYVAHELEQQRRHRHHAEDEERKSASALRDEIAIAESSAEAARELLAGGGVAHVLGTLCRLEARLIGCDATYTFLRDGHDASFAVVASNGDGGSSWASLRALRIPDVVLARLIDRLGRDQPVVIAGQPDMLPVDGTVCIYTALMAGRDVAGIQVAVRRESRPFTPSDVELARRLTHTASAALAEARSAEARQAGLGSQLDFGERMWVDLQTPLGSILRLAEHAADLSLPAAERRALLTRIASTTRDLLHVIERHDRVSTPSGGRSARG